MAMNKRTHTEEQGNKRKRRKSMFDVRDFLDIQAAESGESDEEADYVENELLEFIDNNSDIPGLNSSAVSQALVASGSDDDNLLLDSRLDAIINRYEATAANEEGSENEADENMTIFTERIMRPLPSVNDPNFWRVRVRAGQELESFALLHSRLQRHPELALSVILPVACRTWIGVESCSRAHVENLCRDLSTIRHPLDISLVPVEERVAWLRCHSMAPHVVSPSWVRLQKAPVLKSMDVNRNIIKYAGDLAFVHEMQHGPMVNIWLIPRLPVAIGSDVFCNPNGAERTKRQTKRLPRLLHPKAIGEPQESLDMAHLSDPNVYWYPGRRHKLETIGPGIYRLNDERDGDEYIPPFAVFTVPVEALHTDGIGPKLSELKLFAEGMAIGAKQLNFPAPSPEFMRWSYECHVAAPIEIGTKVEVDMKPGTVRGIVDDVHFDQVSIRMNGTQEYITVDAEHVRRFYEVGDAVKVMKSSHHSDREGWVVSTEDDQVAVFDRALKEEFDVKSWQLIPYDYHEQGFPLKIQVNDVVQVICPTSPHYHKVGKASCVAETSVEVIEHDTNTKFVVPTWFLEIDGAKGRTSQHTSEAPESLNKHYHDRYKELVNTWVVVVGDHREKGLYGRIREHLGDQVLRVEARSGSRLVDIHVDFLLTAEENGKDLRQYHVGRYYQIPAGVEYKINSFLRQPERASTPMPAADGQVEVKVKLEPALEQERVPMISYGDQVLPFNWMMQHGLVTKRIFAHIRNSQPVSNAGGFAKGYHEGERVMIQSGEEVNAIQVHAKTQIITIPGWFLIPQMPTRRGQDVVVISGEKAGEEFLTRKPDGDGTFPLGRRGYTGNALFTMDASRLARCDPISTKPLKRELK